MFGKEQRFIKAQTLVLLLCLLFRLQKSTPRLHWSLFFFFNFAPLGDIFFLFASQICICILRIVLNKLQTKAGIKASALNFKIKSHTIQSKHCFSGLFQVSLKSIYLVGKKGNPL